MRPLPRIAPQRCAGDPGSITPIWNCTWSKEPCSNTPASPSVWSRGSYSEEGYTAAHWYYEAIRAIKGDVEDREQFLAALRKVAISDNPHGPMKMDELSNPIQNVYIRKVERVGRKLQNTVIAPAGTAPQFLSAPLYPDCPFPRPKGLFLLASVLSSDRPGL